jgi:hypothetical protein
MIGPPNHSVNEVANHVRLVPNRHFLAVSAKQLNRLISFPHKSFRTHPRTD